MTRAEVYGVGMFALATPTARVLLAVKKTGETPANEVVEQ